MGLAGMDNRERKMTLLFVDIEVYKDEIGCGTAEVKIENGKRVLDSFKEVRKWEGYEKGKIPNAFYELIDEIKPDYICGHNIIAFDGKYLEEGKKNQNFKYIDTLLISPFLRPEYPFHKLDKEYKIINDTTDNDPVKDSHDCYERLSDEISRYYEMMDTDEEALSIIATLLSRETDKSFYPDTVRKDVSFLHENRNCFLEMMGFVPRKGDLVGIIYDKFGKDLCKSFKAKKQLKKYIAESPWAMGYFLANLFVNMQVGQHYKETNVKRQERRHYANPSYIENSFRGFDQINWDLRGINWNQKGNCKCDYCSRMYAPKNSLNELFGKEDFRVFNRKEKLQEKGVNLALMNKDILAIFPTGGGKSLTFQLPAIMQWEQMGALTVVISPLQSLMNDQVKGLEENNLAGEMVTINGSQTGQKKRDSVAMVKNGQASLLVISPEMLRSRKIRSLLRDRMIARFVIDEAHCFSKWGHEFRPDYQYIGKFINELCEKKGIEHIPVSCFTATANDSVRGDIRDYFDEKCHITLHDCITDSQRENLSYFVRTVSASFTSDDDRKKIRKKIVNAKLDELIKLLDEIKEKEEAQKRNSQNWGSIIVFTSLTETTNIIVERINENYVKSRFFVADRFCGKMKKEDKTQAQDGFMNNSTNVMVATSAFGMGVDKDDVRYVIHFDISQSFEDYIQEAGRAGRDGNPAECYILYTDGDKDLDSVVELQQLNRININEIRSVWNYLCNLQKKRNSKQKELDMVWTSLRSISAKKNTGVKVDKIRAILQLLENEGYLERKDDVVRTWFIPKNREELKSIEFTNNAEKVWSECIFNYISSFENNLEGIDILDLRNETADETEKMLTNNKDKDDFKKIRENFDIFNSLMNKMRGTKAINYSADVRIAKKYNSGPKSYYDIVKQTEEEMINILKNTTDDEKEKGIDFRAKYTEKFRKETGDFHYEEYMKKYEELIPVLNQFDLEHRTIKGKTILGFYSKLIRKILSSWIAEGLVEKRNYFYNYACKTQKNNLNTVIENKTIRHIICDKMIEYVKETDSFVSVNKNEVIKEIRKKHSELKKDISINDVDNALRFLEYTDLVEVIDETVVFNRMMKIQINLDKTKEELGENVYDSLREFYNRNDYQKKILKLLIKSIRNGNIRNLIKNYLTLDWNGFIEQYSKDLEENVFNDEAFYDANDKEPCHYYGSKKLNPEQIKVVDSSDRITYITAGPGSGKTTVLVKKIQSLVTRENYSPEDILMLSFTNATNDTLRDRVRSVIGADAERMDFRTFDSFVYELVGAEAYKFDYRDSNKKSNEELRLQKFEYAAKLLNDFANGENDNFVARELNDQFKNQWNCIFRKRVLILDEAQDLNYYMYKIIVGLIRANYNKGNEYLRVIMVADPDQLIFEYENTDLDNDMRKKAKASVVYMNKLRMLSKDGKKLKKTAPKPLQLTVNYRNNNRIIDFFEEYRNTSGLFSGKDYQRNKPMKAYITQPDNSFKMKDHEEDGVKFCLFPDIKDSKISDEMSSQITERIFDDISNNLINEDSKSFSIGVLARTNYDVQTIKSMLRVKVGKLKNVQIEIVDPDSKKDKSFPLLWLDEFHAIMRRLDDIDSDGIVLFDDLKSVLEDEGENGFRKKYANSIHRDAVISFVSEFANDNSIYLSDLEKKLMETTFDDFLVYKEKYNNPNYHEDNPVDQERIEINVSTIHKAKGKEFDWIYVYAPLKYETDNNLTNLRFVAMTRARERLTIICSSWDEIYEYTHTGKDNFDYSRFRLHPMKEDLDDYSVNDMDCMDFSLSDIQEDPEKYDTYVRYRTNSKVRVQSNINPYYDDKNLLNNYCIDDENWNGYFDDSPNWLQAGVCSARFKAYHEYDNRGGEKISIVHTYLEIKSDDKTGWGKKERIREYKAREIYSYPKLREYVKKIEIKAVVVKKVDGTYRKLLLPEIRL